MSNEQHCDYYFMHNASNVVWKWTCDVGRRRMNSVYVVTGAKEIDIAATLEHIRDQRVSMVKTKVWISFWVSDIGLSLYPISRRRVCVQMVASLVAGFFPCSWLLPLLVGLCLKVFGVTSMLVCQQWGWTTSSVLCQNAKKLDMHD